MTYKRILLITGCVLVLVSTSGCAWLKRARHPEATAIPTVLTLPTAMPTATATEAATATPLPTATSLPAAADTATPLPTASGGPEAVSVEMSEAEVNNYLAGKSFEQSGATLSDLTVQISPTAMTIDGYLQHASTGLAGDITINGVPAVVDNKLYFQVGSITLGPQFTGLVRSLAEMAINQAMDEMGGEYGMPIPVTMPEGVVVTSVGLGDGVLLLEGYRE